MLQNVGVVVSLCRNSVFFLKCLTTLGRYDFHIDFKGQKAFMCPSFSTPVKTISAPRVGAVGEGGLIQEP